MAIVVVQNIAPGSAGVNQGAASTYTPGTPFTVGNTILLVFAGYSLTGNATSVTVNGAACTADSQYVNTGTHALLEFWRISNIASSGNVVINWSGAGAPDGNFALRGILEVSGLAASPVDQVPTVAVNTNTAPSITSSATTLADELVLAGFVLQGPNDPTISQPGGYTPITNDGTWSTDAAGAAAYSIISVTGAQTATWSLNGSSNTWAAGMVTYKAAAGGGGGTIIPTYSSYAVA